MNIDNPIQPLIDEPKGVDVNIQNLRAAMETLPWLERSFGRAVALYEKGDESGIERVPKVPLGKGEYFSVMPNDAQKAFSWFYPVNPLEVLGENEPFAVQSFFTQTVSLYVWCNLEQIDKTDIAISEGLKSDVITLLNKQPGTVIESIWSDDIREVYSGWKLNQVKPDLLYYPYYAMKFELRLKVLQNKC